MIERRIRSDYARETEFFAGPSDIGECLLREVGCNLEEQGPRRGQPRVRIRDYAQQSKERVVLLQSAQALRIRRADVERDVISNRRESPKTVEVIGRSFLEWGHLGLPEIDANRHRGSERALAQMLETLRDNIGTIVVESEAINQGLLFWVAKDSRSRISRLRFGGDGADFHKAESERLPGGDGNAVLIETGGETNWIS